MWQRNDSGHVLDVAAYPTDEDPGRQPFTVGPGEFKEFPELLAGFVETDPPGDADEPAEDAAPAAAKSARKRAATSAPTPEGVDQP